MFCSSVKTGFQFSYKTILIVFINFRIQEASLTQQRGSEVRGWGCLVLCPPTSPPGGGRGRRRSGDMDSPQDSFTVIITGCHLTRGRQNEHFWMGPLPRRCAETGGSFIGRDWGQSAITGYYTAHPFGLHLSSFSTREETKRRSTSLHRLLNWVLLLRINNLVNQC